MCPHQYALGNRSISTSWTCQAMGTASLLRSFFASRNHKIATFPNRKCWDEGRMCSEKRYWGRKLFMSYLNKMDRSRKCFLFGHDAMNHLRA
uniref:Secreted protein n=1 Tax=Steinernema glaseri TaxID=37863 RepID=A0A1I7ZY36_9BILA